MKHLVFRNKKILFPLIARLLRWRLNYSFKNLPLPLGCGLYITNSCNFKCAFCNIWRKPQTNTISLPQGKTIIDDLSSLGCFYLSITGGEPLLVSHVFDMLGYARKSKIKYIHLVTNGWLLDEDSAKKLAQCAPDEISISIDGEADIHDKNRGMPQAYNRAISAIENLKKYAPRIHIVLNAILDPENPYNCLHTVGIANKFNIYAKVQPLNQHPVFDENNRARVSSKAISPVGLKGVISILREEKRIINSAVFLDNIYNFFFDKENLILKGKKCSFGYHHIEISEDGRVYPCLEALLWKNGFKITAGLKEIIFSREYKQLLKGLKTCPACLRNYYICYYEPRLAFSFKK